MITQNNIFTSQGLFAVVVIYKSDFKNSQTYKSIIKNNKFIHLKGIVYDNSPSIQDFRDFPEFGDFEYIHNSQNPGLAVAYNIALKKAAENNCKWLLLLDQDTQFTQDYFLSLTRITDRSSSVIAFSPVVKSIDSREHTISPSILSMGGFKPLKKFSFAEQKQNVSGINSGTILNVDFIADLGGFNVKYSLDMLDHWYFREIYRKEKKVYLLESEIFQNLSVSNNFEQNMSIERYLKFTDVEKLFFKSESFNEYLFYKIRLCFRALKQLKFTNRDYFKATINKILSF